MRHHARHHGSFHILKNSTDGSRTRRARSVSHHSARLWQLIDPPVGHGYTEMNHAAVPGDDTPDLGRLSTVYFALHLAGGHIGLPALVLIFVFSKRVHRPASIINFCVTWILYSVSYSLLMYAGHHRSDNPPFGLCLTQAAMIHGAPAAAVVAAFGVAVQVYSVFHLSCQYTLSATLFRIPRWLLLFLVIVPPYLVFGAFAVSAAFVGLKHPAQVRSISRLYCTVTLETGPFELFAVPVFCIVVLSIITVLEVTMIGQYFWSRLRVKHAFPLVIRGPSLSPWLRVSIFTLYTLAAFGVCISFLTHYVSPLPYMTQAALPLLAALVFGTQTDIFDMLFSCIRRPSEHHDAEYVSGGGWSAPATSTSSRQLAGHTSLVSDV